MEVAGFFMPILSVFATLRKILLRLSSQVQREVDCRRQDGGIVIHRYTTTPQSKIKDFCQLPLHRGAFGCKQRPNMVQYLKMKARNHHDKSPFRLPWQSFSQVTHANLCRRIPGFARFLPYSYYLHTTFENNHILPPT